MTTAGLYDEFEELEALLDEHSHFEQEHPESVSDIENVIREKAMRVISSMNSKALRWRWTILLQLFMKS